MISVSKKIPYRNDKQFNEVTRELDIISIRYCAGNQTDTYSWYLVTYWSY